MSKDIQQLEQYRVLVIGDACQDVYHFGTCDRISPEAPVPVFKNKTIQTREGMCLNVAANLKIFGHEVFVDRNKEEIKKIRIVDERSGQHLLRIDEEPEIEGVDVEKYSDVDLISYSAVIISDYDKGYIQKENISDLIQRIINLRIPLFVDTKKKDISVFKGCIIKINEKENREITSFPENSEIIVTLGSMGCKWRDNIFPTEKVEVHDVCGAGDVFLSGLVHMYLKTKGDIEKSINFANKCASLSVSKFGTCVIDPELLK